MNDLANRVEIKSELAELRAELDQIRLKIANSQDQPTHRGQAMSLLGTEGRPDIVSEKAVTTSTPLENLQRLLARSRGDE